MKKFFVTYIPGLSRVVSNATPLLILFIFSKFLPIEEIGLLSYFIALITLIGIFTDFGMSEGVQRFLPQFRSPRLIFSTLTLELIFCLVGAIVFLMLDSISNGNLSRGYPTLLPFIIFFSASNVIILIFNGLRQDLRTGTYYLLSTFTFLIITFALYFSGTTDAISSFLIGRLVSWIIFSIIPILDLWTRKLIEFHFEVPKGYYRFITNNMIVDISYSLFNQWDAILIINLLGAFQNGIYKSIAFVASLPYALSVILQTKLLPEYSSLVNENRIEELKKSFNKFNNLLLILLVVFVTLSLFFSSFLLKIVYTEEISNQGTKYLMPILLSVMIYVATVPSVCVLLAKGKENIVRNMSIVQAVGFVILSTVFLQQFGLMILPIILVVLNSLYFVVNYSFARRSLVK